MFDFRFEKERNFSRLKDHSILEQVIIPQTPIHIIVLIVYRLILPVSAFLYFTLEGLTKKRFALINFLKVVCFSFSAAVAHSRPK